MKTLLLILVLLQFAAGKYQTVCRFEAHDDDGDEIYWTIKSGNTGGFYQILPCSAVLQVDTAAYQSFKMQRVWTLKIAASDPARNTDVITAKITLRKNAAGVKLPPAIQLTE